MKGILLIFLLCLFHAALCQNGKARNQLSLSIPVILNHSEATYYSLGNPKYPSGTAVSYGANVSYARYINRSIYFIGGLGYFRQRFQIMRPFAYRTSDLLLYSTKSYRYDNMQIFGGVGCRQALSKNAWLRAEATYNSLHSFRQKYIHDKKIRQVNHESFPIGHILFLSLGGERTLTQKLAIGLNVVLPTLHRWNKDDMFFEYDWEPGTQQIARNKYSVGINLSCNYNF